MKMGKLKSFDIKFSGLDNNKHFFYFHIKPDFFKQYDFNEFNDCDIDITIELTKRENLLEFVLKNKGTVNIPCDISGENYDQLIEGEISFIVKFGNEYNNDREDIIIIPYNSFSFNIAQQIYESIILSIPNKRIHPDILTGKMQSKNFKYILNYHDDQEQKIKKKKEIDQRWSELKKLITNKRI